MPRLRVRKNWYVGLNPDPVDHSHPDVGNGLGADNPYEKAVHGGKKQEQLKQQQGVRTSPAAAVPTTAAGGMHQQQQQHVAASQVPQQQQAQQQQPQQQQQQQQQPSTDVTASVSSQSPQQQQQAVGSAPLAAADQAAVLKFRQHLRDYAKEFGQVTPLEMFSSICSASRWQYPNQPHHCRKHTI